MNDAANLLFFDYFGNDFLSQKRPIWEFRSGDMVMEFIQISNLPRFPVGYHNPLLKKPPKPWNSCHGSKFETSFVPKNATKISFYLHVLAYSCTESCGSVTLPGSAPTSIQKKTSLIEIVKTDLEKSRIL